MEIPFVRAFLDGLMNTMRSFISRINQYAIIVNSVLNYSNGLICYTQYLRTAEHLKSAIRMHFVHSKAVLLYDLAQHCNLFIYILLCDEPLDTVSVRHVSTAFMQPRLIIIKEK